MNPFTQIIKKMCILAVECHGNAKNVANFKCSISMIRYTIPKKFVLFVIDPLQTFKKFYIVKLAHGGDVLNDAI